MQASIQPVQVFNFGVADSVTIRSIHDDLSSSATFWYQLGRNETTPEVPAVDPVPEVVDADGNVVTPAIPGVPAVPAVTTWKGADLAIGNVTLSGADYAAWDGSNDAAAALVVAKIPGVSAA